MPKIDTGPFLGSIVMNSLFCVALVSALWMSPARAGGADSELNTRVRAALHRDLGSGAQDVRVDSYGGTVQLTGFVASRSIWHGAAESATGVSGVNHVLNVMVHGGEHPPSIQ